MSPTYKVTRKFAIDSESTRKLRERLARAHAVKYPRLPEKHTAVFWEGEELALVRVYVSERTSAILYLVCKSERWREARPTHIVKSLWTPYEGSLTRKLINGWIAEAEALDPTWAAEQEEKRTHWEKRYKWVALQERAKARKQATAKDLLSAAQKLPAEQGLTGPAKDLLSADRRILRCARKYYAACRELDTLESNEVPR
jgi:hypothetical protein